MLKKLHSIIATKIIEILGLNEQQVEEHIKEYGSLETYLFKCEKDDWYYEEINEDGITKKNWDQSMEKVNLFWECFLVHQPKNDIIRSFQKDINKGYSYFVFPKLPKNNDTVIKIMIQCPLFINSTFLDDINFNKIIFENEVNFEKTTFLGDANFCGATFLGDANFCGATFSGKADFCGATFSGYADFCGATFSGYANFWEATFSGDANFGRATFSGDANFCGATFSGKAVFWKATFSGKADFWRATFSGDAYFQKATFSGDANFMEATFSGKADFWRATFSGDADFQKATFSGDADFQEATFSGDANFRGATFLGKASFWEATFSGKASFWEATFSGDANFGGATFSGDANFMEATFSGDANFRGATFLGKTYFITTTFTNKVNFKNCSFEKILTLKNISFTSENKKTISKPISIFKKISTTLITSIYKDKTEKEDNSENKIIDFEYASINKLIIDNPLVDKDNHFYKDLTLGLHGATIEKIACDQEELLDVKLLSADTGNETTQEHFQIDESLEKNQKKIIMQGIHRSELTVLKDLASMLNMYEKEDEIHKKIMNNELAENISKQMPEKWYYFWEFFKPSFLQLILFDKIIFQYAFGWGIKLWNIFISTIVIISSFSIYYIITGLENIEKKDTIIAAINNPSDITLIENIARSFWISIVSFFGIFLPNYFDGVVGFRSTPEMIAVTESIIGLLWVTVFVAMLSRKFMRM